MTATAERPVNDRTPPHDHHAEQCVLGAMLLTRRAISDVTELLRPDDFYRAHHADIYTTICHLDGQAEPADPITVANHLAATGALARIGGGPYLHTLLQAVPTAANAGHYAAIVAEKAGFRRLIAARDRIDQIIQVGGDLTEAQDRASQAVYDATTGRADSNVIRLRDLIQPTLDAIETAGAHHGLRGLSTGLIDLDKLTHGLQPGQLWVVAGRPGMGKSVCAVDFARSVAVRQDRPVVFFTLEMSREEVMTRFTAAETGIALERLQTGQLSDADWTRVARRLGEVENAPLYMGDGAESTLMQIRATCRRIAAKERDLGLVIVDYLQLMPTVNAGRGNSTREREVAELSRGLKLLAKELRVPVVALSQLNRGVESRSDKRPMLSDLRESGAVEQDSDVVILLYRPEYYEKDKCARKGEVDLIVEKNRHGAQATIAAAAQLKHSRFVDMAFTKF